MAVALSGPVEAEARCGNCEAAIYYGADPTDPWELDEWRSVVDHSYFCDNPVGPRRHRPALPDFTDREDVEAWLNA